MVDSSLADRLKTLCARRGLSWRAASRQAGLNETYVRDVIRGAVRRPSFLALDKLARVLDIPVTSFYDEDRVPAGLAGGPFAGHERDLPILGEARGGSESGHIDPTAPLGFADRPPGLARVTPAYAVVMRGSSMEPRYFDGELLYVHPLKGVRAGDFVLVRLGDGSAFVKRLVEQAEDWVTVAQLRPEATVQYRTDQIEALHRVIGATEEY